MTSGPSVGQRQALGQSRRLPPAWCPILSLIQMHCMQSVHTDAKTPLPGACSCFGELALLYSAPRAATVRTVTECALWVMDRAVYGAIKQAYMEQLAADKRKMIDRVPMLAVLSEVSSCRRSVLCRWRCPQGEASCAASCTENFSAGTTEAGPSGLLRLPCGACTLTAAPCVRHQRSSRSTS